MLIPNGQSLTCIMLYLYSINGKCSTFLQCAWRLGVLSAQFKCAIWSLLLTYLAWTRKRPKFVAGRDERRKKQRIGADNDPNFAEKGSKAAAAAASALGRKVAFSLERLISIYAQVVTSVTQHTAHGCGDVAIYATVSSDKS